MTAILKTIIPGLLLLFILQSCSDNNPPVSVHDPNLIFTGEWIGTTSQMKLFKIEVAEVKSKAWIVECYLGFIEDAKYLQRSISSSNGIANVDQGAFLFSLSDGWVVEGHFDESGTCNGFISKPPVRMDENQRFAFTLHADQSVIDIRSTARLKFELNGQTYDYIQNFDNFFPSADVLSTDSGFVVSSAFNVNGDNITGSRVLEIRYGNFVNNESMLEAFSPGVKNYSVDAANGFEINFFEPGYYFQSWSTSAESGDQSESTFEILDFIEIVTGNQQRLFKFIAVFDCFVYRKWSDGNHIKDGFMIGYLAIERNKSDK